MLIQMILNKHFCILYEPLGALYISFTQHYSIAIHLHSMLTIQLIHKYGEKLHYVGLEQV